MMVLDEHITGTALICDSAGKIVGVSRDDLGIAGVACLGRPMRELVDSASAEKVDLFLAEVQSAGAAFQWPISVLLGNELTLLHFMGAAYGAQTLVVAARSPGVLVRFYEEMSRINNEQSNIIRAAVISDASLKAMAKPVEDAAAFEEMTQLNNELANMQRQLAQQNAELMGLNRELTIARGLLEKKQAELEQANAQLAALATLDGLTGINNRRAFQERMTEEFLRSRRYALSLSLVLCDLDHFKFLNDTFGHPAGDEVLRNTGRLLKASARETDFVARYGGEEFAVILVESDEAAARVSGERFRNAIASESWIHRPITASIGLSTLSQSILTVEAFIGLADRALYHSKKQGRNRVTHHLDLPDFPFHSDGRPQ